MEDEEKLGSKLEEDDKTAILDAVKDALEVVESDDADADALEEALKTLQGVSNPIISKVYGDQGMGGEGGEEEEAEDEHDEL